LLATISTSGMLAGLAMGLDTVYYTIVNSCGTATAKKIVRIVPSASCASGIYESTTEMPAKLNVYPDPNAGTFTIALTGIDDDAHVTITDLTGRIITELQMRANGKAELRLHQPPGLYIIFAATATQRFFSRVSVH